MYSKVYIEITNICNMNCSFCHGHSRELRRMSESEFLTILEKLKGQTEFIYYHLMGEPLTHPMLSHLIKLASDRGYRSIITTNGTLLKRCGKELINSGLHKINISLHSFEDGTEVDFERYLSEVAEFAELASKAGVIIVLRLWNKGYDGGKNQLIIEKLRSLIKGDWAENSRGLRIKEKLFVEWGDRFEWPDSNAEIKGERFFCYGLKDHFGILCDGTVVPCCLDSDGIINLGNIFSEDIADILSSQRAVAMVNGFKCRSASEELCRRCGYAQRFV